MAKHSIWILEYSRVEQLPVSAVVYGAHNRGTLRLPFCYTLVKGDGFAALIDVGYNEDEHGRTISEKFGISNWRDPGTVLGEVGVTPEQITHVILTHGHFDHMGGTELFPNATFFIQERELSRWVWAMSAGRRFRWLMEAVDPGDVLRVVELARQGRLVSLEGAREDLLPCIDIYPAHETHTPGSQYVVIRNDGKRESSDIWVMAGDLLYQFENLHGNNEADPYYVPVGLGSGSQTNMLLAVDEMVKRAHGEMRRVIPAHEEGLKTVFPSRTAKSGLRVTEIALADGEQSRVA
jgi:glyoxylase-like metal-dependent hydrolase (beta-lactamase superfamily II)